MNLNKIGVVLLIIAAIVCGNIINNGVSYAAEPGIANRTGAETWIRANRTNVGMSRLTATIRVRIKNNKDHVQYFRISHVYTGSLVDDTIRWRVVGTDPAAKRMIDAVSPDPELGGDFGWRINPGDTKNVSFTVNAVGRMGEIPTHILNPGAVENRFWPLIPAPGLMASWFRPNEIETLNPNLDMRSWRGTFSFLLTNHRPYTVSGIIRAPIVPVDSKFTHSNPPATFNDRDLVANTRIAAWDVAIGAGASRWFTYTYEWPLPTPPIPPRPDVPPRPGVAAREVTPPVPTIPTREAGLPHALFVIGGVLVIGGLIYARKFIS